MGIYLLGEGIKVSGGGGSVRVCARDYTSISTKNTLTSTALTYQEKKENALTTTKKEKCTLQHQYSMHAPGGVVRVYVCGSTCYSHPPR